MYCGEISLIFSYWTALVCVRGEGFVNITTWGIEGDAESSCWGKGLIWSWWKVCIFLFSIFVRRLKWLWGRGGSSWHIWEQVINPPLFRQPKYPPSSQCSSHFLLFLHPLHGGYFSHRVALSNNDTWCYWVCFWCVNLCRLKHGDCRLIVSFLVVHALHLPSKAQVHNAWFLGWKTATIVVPGLSCKPLVG